MNYEVIIGLQAKADILEIISYISDNDSPGAAQELFIKLEKACCKLEKFSHRGHIPKEIKPAGIKKFLEIIFTNYRIIYEIKSSRVFVHSVLDGRRNIQNILTERMLR